MIVIGIDPSLTGFGISDGERHEIISTTAADSLENRARSIAERVWAFVPKERNESQRWFVEAPAFGHARGASHLYELGFLICDLYHAATHTAGRVAANVEIVMVNPSTLRKFVTGKGNTKKDEMKLKVWRRWGMEFEQDPGSDKLFAYCLYRYGAAVINGETEHIPIAKRGSKRKKVA